MLARIAHELYWIGRRLSRAEHTARMLDGVFHADLQGAPEDPTGVRLSWDSLLAIMGTDAGAAHPSRDAVLQRLTVDPSEPTSVLSCVLAAREGARTVRDVLSTEQWEALNTFHLDLLGQDVSAALEAGPYSIYQFVKERCGLFWGVTERTMLRDEAHAFLVAGATLEAADMVLRMLRVALPPAATPDEDGREPERDGQALALLHAAGGYQAFRRAVARPTNARPVAAFLLYERAYPDSVAASVDALHSALCEADHRPRASAPVLRAARLAADLEFRRRLGEDGEPQLADTLPVVQYELSLLDQDVALRYFGGAPLTAGATT